jgi:hypothetical protein
MTTRHRVLAPRQLAQLRRLLDSLPLQLPSHRGILWHQSNAMM